uniref:Uncharacterized protein n=1 Tax=Rhizophora mucronata TaxID=61149 RepID=A0A2P2IVR6_RHIMU
MCKKHGAKKREQRTKFLSSFEGLTTPCQKGLSQSLVTPLTPL